MLPSGLGFPSVHASFDAESLGLVGRCGDYRSLGAPDDGYGLATEFRLMLLLDRREKCNHIDVEDNSLFAVHGLVLALAIYGISQNFLRQLA